MSGFDKFNLESKAMEHWGLIGFKETALLYSPTENSLYNKQDVALIIAHELAHFVCAWHSFIIRAYFFLNTKKHYIKHVFDLEFNQSGLGIMSRAFGGKTHFENIDYFSTLKM